MSEDIEFIIIKGTYSCPWCEMAAEDLRLRGYRYVVQSLGRDKLIEVGRHAGMSTVPIIYHRTYLVGGYDKLKNYLDSLK